MVCKCSRSTARANRLLLLPASSTSRPQALRRTTTNLRFRNSRDPPLGLYSRSPCSFESSIWFSDDSANCLDAKSSLPVFGFRRYPPDGAGKEWSGNALLGWNRKSDRHILCIDIGFSCVVSADMVFGCSEPGIVLRCPQPRGREIRDGNSLSEDLAPRPALAMRGTQWSAEPDRSRDRHAHRKQRGGSADLRVRSAERPPEFYSLLSLLYSLGPGPPDLRVRSAAHPSENPAPTGREPTRTGWPPDQFVSQTVRRPSTTSLRAMS